MRNQTVHRHLMLDWLVCLGVVIALVAMALWCDQAKAEPLQAKRVCGPVLKLPEWKRANFGVRRRSHEILPRCAYEHPGQATDGVPASVPIRDGLVVDVWTGYRVPAVRRNVYGPAYMYRGHTWTHRGHRYQYTPTHVIHTVRERWVE